MSNGRARHDVRLAIRDNGRPRTGIAAAAAGNGLSGMGTGRDLRRRCPGPAADGWVVKGELRLDHRRWRSKS
jgi:hypothetical protein